MSPRRRAVGESSTLRPDWLLRHAEQLLSRSSDTDRPRTINPRRAVSAAYYAVFHYTVMWAVASVVPLPGRAQVCRSVDHSDVEAVAKWVDGSGPRYLSILVELARQSSHVREWASLYPTLKVERHLADYSHDVVFDRIGALSIVKQAHKAIAALDGARVDDPAWQSLASLIVLKVQPKNRE